MIGKILSIPVDILNIPAKVADRFIGDDEGIFSAPLDAVSEFLKDIDKDEGNK